jgi:hypothetical protein
MFILLLVILPLVLGAITVYYFKRKRPDSLNAMQYFFAGWIACMLFRYAVEWIVGFIYPLG